MQCPSQQLFPRAGLARDQDGGFRVGYDPGGALERGTQGGAFPHDLAKSVRLGFQVRQGGASQGGAAPLHGDGERVAQPVPVVREGEVVRRAGRDGLRRHAM